jgi:hypothetical protein
MQRRIFEFEYECDKCGKLAITKSINDKGVLPKDWYALPGIYPMVFHYCQQCYNDHQLWKTKWICSRCGEKEFSKELPVDWLRVNDWVFCEYCK